MSDSQRHLEGGLMFAAGMLISLLSGGCTLAFWVPALPNILNGRDVEGGMLLPVGLVFGGIPFAGGLALALVGWRRMRRPKRPRADVFGERPPSA